MYSFSRKTRSTITVPSALLLFGCMLFSGSAYATTYNAVNDYSIAANPNGAWSYLYASTLLQTSGTNFAGQAGLDYWWSAGSVPNSEVVVKNITSTPVSLLTIIVPPDHLLLDPESASDVDVRFTAPAAGNYSITGNFLGIDVDEASHAVEVLDNGVIVFNGTIATYGQTDTFSLVESLHAGDVLDFESLTGSSFRYLSTGLAVTITPASAAAPEPASLWIAGLGLTGFSLLRFRRGSQRKINS